MAYVNRPTSNDVSEHIVTNNSVVDYHVRIRWGSIILGIAIALATQLILSVIFAAIGVTNIAGYGALRTTATDVADSVGIWATIELLISLLIGGWATTQLAMIKTQRSPSVSTEVLHATADKTSDAILLPELRTSS